jgi:DNA-binding response OmpR family regulator
MIATSPDIKPRVLLGCPDRTALSDKEYTEAVNNAVKIANENGFLCIQNHPRWSLDTDKEEAYAGGGDDYLVKPFSSRELLMKVDALTRRYNSYSAKGESSPEIIRLFGGVLIYPDQREVCKNGGVIDVRDKEYEVLLFLAKNRGRVVSPSELYEGVWGEMSLPSSNNTITVHILNLRRKLEDDPSSPKIIRTVWGKGYQID